MYSADNSPFTRTPATTHLRYTGLHSQRLAGAAFVVGNRRSATAHLSMRYFGA